MFPREASKRLCAGGCLPRHTEAKAGLSRPTSLNSQLSKRSSARAAFTLLELLIVIGIIALLLVLLVPAFTTIKSGTDMTSTLYGIQGLLENARTYAKANHTYVFVGFAEVDASVDPSVSPQVAGNGRVAVAVIASKDGTRHFQYLTSGQGTDWQSNYADPSKPEYRGGHLVALRKLERFENLHFLVDFGSWLPSQHPGSNMARNQPTGTFYTLGTQGRHPRHPSPGLWARHWIQVTSIDLTKSSCLIPRASPVSQDQQMRMRLPALWKLIFNRHAERLSRLYLSARTSGIRR